MKYDYRCEHCGEEIERDCPIGTAPQKVKSKCGKMAARVHGVPMMKSVLTKV